MPPMAKGYNPMHEDDDSAASSEQSAPKLVSVREAMATLPWGRFHWLLFCACGIGYCADTVELLLLSFVLPALADEWPGLDRLTLSLAYVFGNFGIIIGALCWGQVADRCGRRVAFLGSVSTTFVCGLLSAVSGNFGVFVATRFGVGLGLGGNLAVDFTIFLEFVQERLRGRVMMLLTMWGVAGVGFISLTAWFVLSAHGWRWYTAAGSLPSGILLLMRLTVPESPLHLWSKGKGGEAWDVLLSIAERNGAPDALEGLALHPAPLTTNSVSQTDGEVTLPAAATDAAATDAAGTPVALSLKETFHGILGPEIRGTTLSLWATWFFQSFAYGGFTLWLPAFLATQGFHSDVQIYQNYGLMAAAEVPGLLLATALVNIVGRKWLLCGLLVACSITTALCATDPGPASVTTLTVLMYFFVVGAWATLYVITPEAYPTNVRSTASGVTRIWACLGGMTAGPMGALIMQQHSNSTLMLLYAAAFACACVVVALAMPASLGKSIID